jgi:hypothetical protein
MRRSCLAPLSAVAFAFALFTCPTVHAQTTDARAPNDADTHYEFDDDDLLANAFGAEGVLLRMRSGPVRTLLIHPRTQFVAEMLKSVEHL